VTVLERIASGDVDAVAERLLADVGRGFPTPDLVKASAALFERWRIPERLIKVAPAELFRRDGSLTPSALKGIELGFVVARCDREMVEGPRTRVVVSPGTFAVRRSDPVKRDRALERAREGAAKRAELVLAIERATACYEGCRCGEHWTEPQGVSRLHTWSARSRSRMVERLQELDYAPLFADRGVPAMLTLTYPGDWLAVCPSPSVARRHIRLLQLRWKRRWGSRLIGTWKREFQRRGAPHYHILTTPPADPGFRDWLSLTWAQIVNAPWCGDWCWQRKPEKPVGLVWHPSRYRARVGSGACCEYGRHVAGGTGVDYAEGGRATDPTRLAIYFAKHGGYAAKEYQNSASWHWVHEATCVDAGCEGCSAEGVGRFWGFWGLERAIAATEVADDVGQAAQRIARRHSRANSYFVRVPVWRADSKTGVLRRRWSKRRVYRMRGKGGFVSVNDGPGFASSVATGVARQVFLTQVTPVYRLPSGRGRVGTSGGRPIGYLP
jgi:hypothetical protein